MGRCPEPAGHDYWLNDAGYNAATTYECKVKAIEGGIARESDGNDDCQRYYDIFSQWPASGVTGPTACTQTGTALSPVGQACVP